MEISSRFNKYFHALLSDILNSGENLFIENSLFNLTVFIDKNNIESLKTLFKFTDNNFPKDSNSKTKGLSNSDSFYLASLYGGFPVSIKELTSEQLLNHVSFIDNICSKNNIVIKGSRWDIIMQNIVEP